MSRTADHDQRNAAFREAFLKPLGFAASATATGEQVPAEARKLGTEHHVEDIPNAAGARLHWLGDRAAPKVLLYFHGGGFAVPILEGHVRFLKQSIDRLSTSGHNFSVAVLEYNLAPTTKFPVQITQAVESLRHVLSKGYEPRNIVMGGDSAGGNLSLAVLSTILHGFDGIEPLRLEDKLAGVLLISPWVSFNTDAASWTENATKDIIPKECVFELTAAYIEPKDHNKYSEPAKADAEWWSALPAQKLLNVYGAYEVFRDDIFQIGQKLDQSGNSVHNVPCEQQVHIDCVIDAQTEMEAGKMSHVIWEWLATVF